MGNNIYNNLSQDELKVSYWYVTHRVILRKVAILLLAVASGALLLYGVYGLINFYSIGAKESAALQTSLTGDRLNYQLLAEANKPKDLVVIDTAILKNGENYDLVSQISNPNLQWAVEAFDYYFIIGETKTDIRTSFILPNQVKFALVLNYKSDGVSGADLAIENVRWKKVSDFQSLSEKMIQFTFENQEISSSKQSGLSQKESVSNIKFDVLNNSAYNYWEPKFIVLVMRGEALAAITEVVLDGISSGERKTESVNLFETLPTGTTLQIFPDVNILDPSVFKGFEGGLANPQL